MRFRYAGWLTLSAALPLVLAAQQSLAAVSGANDTLTISSTDGDSSSIASSATSSEGNVGDFIAEGLGVSRTSSTASGSSSLSNGDTSSDSTSTLFVTSFVTVDSSSASAKPSATGRGNGTQTLHSSGVVSLNGSSLNAEAIMSSILKDYPSSVFTETNPITYNSTGFVPSFTQPSEGSGFDYASACNLEYQYYSGQSAITTKTTTTMTTLTQWENLGSTTTLCDNTMKRLVGNLTSTNIQTTVYPSTVYLNTSMPAPTCNLDSADCSVVRASWTSASSAYTLWKSAMETSLWFDPKGEVVTMGNDVTGYVASTLGPENAVTLDNTAYTGTSGIYVFPYQVPPKYSSDWWTLNVTSYDAGQYETAEIYPKSAIQWVGDWQTPRCQHTSEDICGQCTIQGGSVRLLYAPVTAGYTKDMCAQTYTAEGTACPYGATRPVHTTSFEQLPPCDYIGLNASRAVGSGPSAVVDGQTYYENLAYISLETIFATNKCGRVGQGHAGTILSLQSSEVYSQCPGYFLSASATPFNFADLNGDVPYAAWKCAMRCDHGGLPVDSIVYDVLGGTLDAEVHLNGDIFPYCDIIAQEAFAPKLAVPPQVMTIDPAWSTCGMDLNGLYDPPSALHFATTAAGPTTPTLAATPAAGVTGTDAAETTTAANGPVETSAKETAATENNQASPTNAGDDGSNQSTDEAISDLGGMIASVAANTDQASATNEAGNEATQSADDDVDDLAGLVASIAADPSPANSGTEGAAAAQPSANDTPSGEQDDQPTNAAEVLEEATQTTNAQAPDGTLEASQAAPSIASISTDDDTSDDDTEDPQISSNDGNAFATSANDVSDPAQPTAAMPAAVFTGNGQVYTASMDPDTPNVAVVDGKTLSVGGPAMTMTGDNVVSMASGGLVQGDQTLVFSSASETATDGIAAFTNDGQAYTASLDPQIQDVAVIGGTTLSAGGPAMTMSGDHTVSMASGGVLIEDGQAMTFSDAGNSDGAAIASGSTGNTQTDISTPSGSATAGPGQGGTQTADSGTAESGSATSTNPNAAVKETRHLVSVILSGVLVVVCISV